jgi:hypothetical protein
MEFEFDIVHVGGKDNEDADELSRQYVNAISVDWKEIADEQKADASLQEFKIKNPHCLHVKDGITYHRDEAGQLRLFLSSMIVWVIEAKLEPVVSGYCPLTASRMTRGNVTFSPYLTIPNSYSSTKELYKSDAVFLANHKLPLE